MNLRSLLPIGVFLAGLASAGPSALLAVDCQLINAAEDSIRLLVAADAHAGALQVRGPDELLDGPFQRIPAEGVLLESGDAVWLRVDPADLPIHGHFTRLTLQLEQDQGDPSPCHLLHRVLPGAGAASVNLLPIRSDNLIPLVVRDDEAPGEVALFSFEGVFDLGPAPRQRPVERKAPSDGGRLSALELQKKAATQAHAARARRYQVPAPRRDGFMEAPAERKDEPPPQADPGPARQGGCVIL